MDSPAWRLVEALQTLVSPDGNTVTVDGWYENVLPLTQHQKGPDRREREPRSRGDEGISCLHWIDDLPFAKAMERLAAEPTINIEGLVAGYTGPGGKTILPGRAVAKIDCRLVPDMTIDDASAVKAYLAQGLRRHRGQRDGRLRPDRNRRRQRADPGRKS